MSVKQDRSYVRTAADFERKYNFGKTFAEAMGLANDSKRLAEEAKDAVVKLDQKLGGEEIFNRLTNNGEIEGIYRDEEGNVYVNASWINSGILTIKDPEGNVIFSANVDNGEVIINPDSIMLGAGKTLAQAMKDSKALQVLLSNEYQSIPTDSGGNYTTFPECSTAIQVLYGQTDITSQCTLTATTSAGVTGSLSGTTYKVAGLTADTGWVDIKATYLGTLTAVKRFTISKVKDGAQGEKGETGAKGATGASGRVYILESSVTTIKRGQDSVPVPDEITFSAYYRDGSSATRTAYAGRFKIERSTDGNSWKTVYTSSANESSCRYELYTAIEDGNGNYLQDGNGNVIVAWYDEDAVMFRGTLYAAGGTTSALDMQTVPVVIDVDALTHEQIFNLVTDNGRIQGIVMINGQLYFNGTYIMSKSITADKLSVNDLYAMAAKIGGWNINEDNIASATNDTVLGSNGTIRVGAVNSWHVQLGADGVFEQYRNATNRVIGIGAKADEPDVNNVVLEAYTQIPNILHVNSVEVVDTLYTGSSIDAGGLSVRGYKNREVETEHYGNRLLFSYETPSPMFGDIGNSVIDDTGIGYIWLEDIFAETVDVDCDYQVFLQAYGEGSVYVAERTPYCFVVKGTPGLAFGWELKAMQKGYDSLRMEVKGNNQIEKDAVDYADEALNYMSCYYKELEEEMV